MIYSFVSASVYALCATLDPAGQPTTRAKNLTTNFVLSQIGKMPRVLRAGVSVLICLAIAVCYMRERKTPMQLALRDRQLFLERLRGSRLGPLRDVSQLLTSFTAMGLFSFQPEGA